MMEQLDLFATEPTEEWAFDLLRPMLSETLQRNNAGKDNLKAKRGKNFTSVSFLTCDTSKQPPKEKTHLIFRIRCRNNQYYFGVSNMYTFLASEVISNTVNPNEGNDGFTNFQFDPSADGVRYFGNFLCSVLEAVVDSIPKEFDCCSKYQQCSDAGKCIHPNPDMAITCGYRKIMKQGHIYYGKNRNID